MTKQSSRSNLSYGPGPVMELLWLFSSLESDIAAAIRELESGLPASALAILGRARARVDEWRRTPDQESP